MKKPLNILVVSPIPTHPTNHGNRARLKGLLEAIRGLGHQVVLVFGAREAIDIKAEAEMAELVDHLLVVHPVERVSHSPKRGGFDLDEWWMTEVETALAHVRKNIRFDVAIATYVWFSKWLEDLPPTVYKIIDTHDVFADRYDRLATVGLEPQFYSTTKDREENGLRRADAIIAIQDDEAKAFKERGLKNIHILGHLTKDYSLEEETRSQKPSLRVGFFGSNNSLNQKAVALLMAELATRPMQTEIDWVLAGSISTESVAANWPGEKMAAIEHPSAFYAAVDLVINPHMGGTGLKIKSVEALSYGKPLVGTIDAMIGLKSDHPYHALNTVEDVVASVEHLAHDKEELNALQKASIRLFNTYQTAQRATLENLLNPARLAEKGS